MINGFIGPSVVQAVNDQWPARWLKEDGSFNRKWSTADLPAAAEWIRQAVTPALVSEITGIKGLMADPDLFGAGLHCIPPGGFLNMHVDFNRHPNGWHRRVNVLIYLNQDWRDEWGGALRLGLKPFVEYLPIAGRCVIFETTDDSWHGHPEPITCPKDVQRRSMALYFYTPEPPPGEAHSTIYKKK